MSGARAGVAAAHRPAAEAGVELLRAGGNAADAAVAAGASIAVTSPHVCGLGGDLLALVTDPAGGPVAACNASGRAGSGADAEALRAEGHERMPFRGDVRAVTVPGCVDGLLAIHARFGRLPLIDVLAPAIALARDGFGVSATLARAVGRLDPSVRRGAFGDAPLRRDDVLRLPRIADVLERIAAGGRAAFYEGNPGEELIRLGDGLFSAEDLRRPQADWVAALSTRAFGHTLWTTAPNSQGYLALAGAWIADRVGLSADPADPAWVVTLARAAWQAGYDRPEVLHEHADGIALLAESRLAPRAAAVAAGAPAPEPSDHPGAMDTTYLCAVDADGRGVSLILSNAADFGIRRVLPGSGIFLHNRGIGFSLEAGHAAELGPGRRPPHTLSPLAVTDAAGRLRAVLGSQGGDAQPQVGLQLLARALCAGEDPADAVPAPRFVLARDETTGFDTWRPPPPFVALEPGAPVGWAPALRAAGFDLRADATAVGFGHAQMIAVDPSGVVTGAADPRAIDGAFVPA